MTVAAPELLLKPAGATTSLPTARGSRSPSSCSSGTGCTTCSADWLSALTVLIGGLLAYGASLAVDVSFLLPFAAGNFLYIAASDLVPEVKRDRDLRVNLLHSACLVAGMALLYILRVALEGM